MRAYAETVEAFSDGLDWYASHWVTNRVDNCCFVPYDRPEAYLRNVGLLAEVAKTYRCRGLLPDLEYYDASPPETGHSGPMNPKHRPEPWPNDPGIGGFAESLAKILKPAGMVFGGYVNTQEIERFPGLRKLLRRVSHFMDSPGLLLGEDFTGSLWNRAGEESDSRYVPGFDSSPRGLTLARREKVSWVYDGSKRLLPKDPSEDSEK
jgi:hypothetical protein